MDNPPPPLPPPGPVGAPWPAAPMMVYQPVVDAEHLKLLAIFHYIVGAFAILFSSIFIVHIVIGLAALSHPGFFEQPSRVPSPPVVHSPPTGSPDETVANDDPTPTPAFRQTPTQRVQPFPDKFFGYMFVGMGSAAVLIGWTFGACTIYSGRCIARRRRRIFSMVIAGFNCLHVPFGTALGVFTFIVLGRPSVVALYAANRKDAA